MKTLTLLFSILILFTEDASANTGTHFLEYQVDVSDVVPLYSLQLLSEGKRIGRSIIKTKDVKEEIKQANTSRSCNYQWQLDAAKKEASSIGSVKKEIVIESNLTLPSTAAPLSGPELHMNTTPPSEPSLTKDEKLANLIEKAKEFRYLLKQARKEGGPKSALVMKSFRLGLPIPISSDSTAVKFLLAIRGREKSEIVTLLRLACLNDFRKGSSSEQSLNILAWNSWAFKSTFNPTKKLPNLEGMLQITADKVGFAFAKSNSEVSGTNELFEAGKEKLKDSLKKKKKKKECLL